MAVAAELGRAGAVPPLAKLLMLLVPLMGMSLPVMVALAVGAATFSQRQWRAERDRILVSPEAKDLDWPRLDHRAVLTFGQLLPQAVALGFFAAWLAILIQIKG